VLNAKITKYIKVGNNRVNMIIKKMKIGLIKPSSYNPRVMTEEEFNNLKQNIKEFGFVDPLIINKDNSLVGGHQRLKALKELGYKDVEVIVVNLSKAKEKLLNISLNKISGDWDYDLLNKVIGEIDKIDYKFTGFTEKELEGLNNMFDYTSLQEEVNQLEQDDKQKVEWKAVFENEAKAKEVFDKLLKVKRGKKIYNYRSAESNAVILSILVNSYLGVKDDGRGKKI